MLKSFCFEITQNLLNSKVTCVFGKREGLGSSSSSWSVLWEGKGDGKFTIANETEREGMGSSLSSAFIVRGREREKS